MLNNIRIIVCWLSEILICPNCDKADGHNCGNCFIKKHFWEKVKHYTM